MKKITITIDALGNDAFAENGEYEISRILRKLADQLEEGEMPGKLRDINGNTVGVVEYK